MATTQAQARLEVASGTYQKIQAELQQLVGARGRLDAQRTENEAVRKVRTNSIPPAFPPARSASR
jgi:hypothetical protein